MSVVVTGLGVVTPYGADLTEVRRRWAAREAVAVAPPPDERPALERPWIARIPEDFDPGAWVRRRKELKLMARANVLAVAAARLAMRSAGLGEADAPSEDEGLFLAVGLEPASLEDILPTVAHSRVDGHLDLLRLSEVGMRQMNPLASIKTLPNMSHAHVSIALGLTGPGMTLCAGPEAGHEAVVEALRALRSGRSRRCLVGAAEAAIDFPERVSASRRDVVGAVAEAAVVLVLETLESAHARGATVLGLADDLLTGPAERPPFGDCGAAAFLLASALALRPATPRAPAIHSRSTRIVVALSALGLRSPLGNEFETFSRRLLAGESAVAPITLFPRAGFPVQLACEVGAEGTMPLPESLWHAMAGLDDRKGELALAAALSAVSAYGEPLPEGTALIYGTGLSSVSVQELEEDCLPFVDGDGRFGYAAFGRRVVEGAIGPQAPRRHAVERPMDLLAAHLRLRGRRASHFSACAAGAAALGHAADLIRAGEAPAALAGAADSMIHPFGLLPFILLGATTTSTDPATAARPFDRRRDGFVMGEGAAFFILEPLERARAAGRRVLGVVLGHGTSSDAHNVTAPHPEGRGAELAMRRALGDAGLESARVGYVNAHGTGTPLNDTIEAAAIRRVFGVRSPPVSSSKAQFGHLIAAAGAVETAACLAAFAGGRLPPNSTLDEPDPRVDLDLVERQGRRAEVEVSLSNSFGFGGQNATLALGHPAAFGV